MIISKEFVKNVRERLSNEPGISITRLASEMNAAEAHVVTALPVKMRKKAKPEDLSAILAWICANGVDMPQNGFAAESLGSIWFVNHPENKDEKRSVQFFDKTGARLASVWLNNEHDDKTYDSLCERFGVTPVPHMHCGGCGNCTCGGKHKEHAHHH